MYLPKSGGQLMLGRDAECEQKFEDTEVSRKHARIAEREGKYYLQDLGSTNGTFLNGESLEAGKWVEFRPGDVLSLGKKVEINRSPYDLPEQLPELQLPTNNQSLHVGRAEGNQLQLTWPDTSRSHAVIQNQNGQNSILDKGSSNGTFVNGRRIPSQQWITLQPGAHVQFGSAPQAAFSLVQAPPPEPASRALPTAFRILNAMQSEAILQKAQFAPNPVRVRAMGSPDCTKEFLKAKGLQPKTTFFCGDTKIHFSEPYSLGHNRAACVGYVEDKQGNIHVRAFYRSNSQGLWRSASHAGFNGWIGKGQGEDSTNLPMVLQMALHSQADRFVKPMALPDANQAFYGSLPAGGTEAPQELRVQLQEPQTLGSFTRKLPDGRGEPESFRFDTPEQTPNFQRLEASYSFQHPLHGQVKADCYLSHNGECSYLFYSDAKGRSWLAQMERADSPLTSWGTRAQPIKHGELAMPAVEYYQQIPKGYLGERVNSEYGDASRYVHSLPVVAEYRRNQGLA